MIASIEITNHTKENCGEDSFRRKALEIVKGLLNDPGIGGKEARQDVTLEHNQHERRAAQYGEKNLHGAKITQIRDREMPCDTIFVYLWCRDRNAPFRSRIVLPCRAACNPV